MLALMFTSLGSAYLSLGVGNALAGLGIAVLKSAIVVAVFMGLARGPAVLRIVAATALATWLVLISLSAIDYATRPRDPAAYQAPAQAWPAAAPTP